MALLQVHARSTHAYDDGWAELDQWRRLGAVKLLPERQVRKPSALGDEGVYLVNAIALKPPANKRATRRFAQALADTMSVGGCHHEHDCCGCRLQHARVIHAQGRRFVVRLSSSRNF